MKLLKSSAAVLVALLAVSFSANAQEDNNRYNDGSVQRGPYVTNELGDNWFLGIGGGVNTMYDNKKIGNIGIAAEAYVGKWFTPAIGVRAGYHGFSDQAASAGGNFVYGTDAFNLHIAHADLLWNVATSIDGYKETRVWNPILYPQVDGIFTLQNGKNRRITLGVGAGWLNSFRINDIINVNLDISAVAAREKTWRTKGRVSFFPSATVGLSFNLGKTGFKRLASCMPTVAPVDHALIDKLNNQLDKAEDKLAASEKEINALKAKLAQYNLEEGEVYEYKDGKFVKTEIREADQPEIFYFDKGKTTLTERELARLEFYAQNSFKKDKKYVITGGADAGTGSAATNERLSKQRAEYVKNILVNSYGFKAENFETKADVLKSDSPIKGRIVTVIAK